MCIYKPTHSINDTYKIIRRMYKDICMYMCWRYSIDGPPLLISASDQNTHTHTHTEQARNFDQNSSGEVFEREIAVVVDVCVCVRLVVV